MSSFLPEEFGDYSDEELIRAIVQGSRWDLDDTPEVPGASDSSAELPTPLYLEFCRRFDSTIQRAARWFGYSKKEGYSEERALNKVLLALLYGHRALARIDGTGMFEGEFLGLAKRVYEGERKPSNLNEGELNKLAEGAKGRTVRDRLEEMLTELDHSEQSERSPRFIDYMPEQSLSGISSPTNELRGFLNDLLEQKWTRKDEMEDEVKELTGEEREYGSRHEDLLGQARKAKRAAEAVSFAGAESDLFAKYDRSQEGTVRGWLFEVAKRLFNSSREKRENKAVQSHSSQNQGQSSQQQGRGQTVLVANAPNDPDEDLADHRISRGVPEIIEFAEEEYGLDPSSDLGISGELTEKPIPIKIELIDWLSSEHQEWFRTTHYYTVPICYREALEEVEMATLRYQFMGADLPADLDHASSTGDSDLSVDKARSRYMDRWHDHVCAKIRDNGGEQTPNRNTIGNWVKRGRDDFEDAIKEEWPDPQAGDLVEVLHVNPSGDNPD